MLDKFNMSIAQTGRNAAVSTSSICSLVNVVVATHFAVPALATTLVSQLVTIVVDELTSSLRSVKDKVVFDTDSDGTGTVGDDVLAARGLGIQL